MRGNNTQLVLHFIRTIALIQRVDNIEKMFSISFTLHLNMFNNKLQCIKAVVSYARQHRDLNGTP